MLKILRSVVFMLILSAVCTAVPAWLKESTADRVRGHEMLKIRRNVLTAMKLIDPGETPERIRESFKRMIDVTERNDRTYWATTREVDSAIVAFGIRGPGFWGPIEGVVAVDPRTFRVMGVTFTKHSETPGLGGRIDEEWFQEQFVDIPLDPESGEPMVRLMSPGTGSRPTDVDAITGATETSRKIQQLFDTDVRDALRTLREDHS